MVINAPFLYLALSFLLSYALSAAFEKRGRLFAVLLILGSLAAHLSVALWLQTAPASDFETLLGLSRLLNSGDFAALNGSPYFTRWAYQSAFVIYQALILRAFPGEITPLLVMNAVFMTGIKALIYAILRCGYGRKTAVFVTLAYCFYPAPYFLASVLTNQHISLFFTLLGVWVFLRKQNAGSGAAGGALLALGNALRPDAGIVTVSLLAVGLLSVRRKGGWRAALSPAAAAGCCALVGMLLSALVAFSGVNPNGLKNSDPLWKFVVGLNAETGGGYSSELAAKVFGVEDAEERHTLQRQIIGEHLSAGPAPLLGFLAGKAQTAWRAAEGTHWAVAGQEDRIVPVVNRRLENVVNMLKRAERPHFWLTSSLAAVTAVLLWRKKEADPFLLLSGAVVALFFAVHLLIEFQPRYRYFVTPFLFFLSGTGYQAVSGAAAAALRRIRRPRKPIVLES